MLPLCFSTEGIRLILPNSCVRWLSVCTWCRPIRKEGCATWDGGNSTWGGRVRVFGTVPVYVSVQEIAGGEGAILAGRVVKGMAPKKTSTSAAPAKNQAAIRQLIDDHVVAALEAQAANMENTNNTNRNPSQEKLMLNCTEKYKVKFANGTLTKDALSWLNSYAKPIRIEQADKIAWTKLKRLLTNKYCPRTEVKKMEDEFYNLVVKENDLMTYARRF
nr:reverse transcriptase domain-containing protein [Tanacetum cinerariifolium]